MEFIILLLTALVVDHLSAGIIGAPENAVYQNRGVSEAYVKCITESNIDGFIWSFNGANIYAYGKVKNAFKYHVSSDAKASGNYTLKIINLGRSDSGLYTCEVFGSDNRSAIITVADPPGQPAVTPSQSSLTENQLVTFTCTSSGGYPMPAMNWTKRGEVIPYENVTTSSVGDTVTSRVQIFLTYRDNGADINCNASNNLTSVSKSYLMSVRFAPKINLDIIGGQTVVLRETAFTLSCSVLSHPPYTEISWKRSETSLNFNGSNYTEAAGIQDDTEYVCSARNVIGTSEAKKTITVNYAPVVRIEQGNLITMNESSSMTLRCVADAKPAATVKWIKDGVVLSTDSELAMNAINRNKAGLYRCLATNNPLNAEEKSAEGSVHISVTYPPGKPNLTANALQVSGIWQAGSSMRLSCYLPENEVGSPASNYMWYKNDVQVPGESSTLTISSLKVEDSGDYSCRASNSAGSKLSDTFSIVVHDVPELISSSPSTLNVSTSDSNAKMSCTFRGSPKPDVLWYKKGEVIVPGPSYTVTESLSTNGSYKVVTSLLLFTGFSKKAADSSDFSNYQCRASSTEGTAKSHGNFTLFVIFSPQYNGIAKAAAELQTGANITCHIRSYPPAGSIRFKRNGIELSQSESRMIYNIEYNINSEVHSQRRVMRIHSVSQSDYGIYSCHAENSAGAAEFPINLQPPSVPDAPTGLAFKQLSWDSVTLSWIPAFDGGKPQEFSIYVNGAAKIASVTASEFYIKGLLPFTKYEIKMLAKNSLGYSSFSQPVQLMTSNLSIPVPSLTYIPAGNLLRVSVNASNLFCVLIEGSSNKIEYKAINNGRCEEVVFFKEFQISGVVYSYFRARVCVKGRENDVCSKPSDEVTIPNTDVKWIIIGVVLGAFVLVVVLVIIAVAVRYNKKLRHHRNSNKLPLSGSANGHINPVMVSDYEQTYSIENNLNENCYEEERTGRPNHFRDNDRKEVSANLETIYASIKKENSVKKLNNYSEDFELQPQPSPTASNSDNTDGDRLDTLSYTNDPQRLTKLIGSPAPFHRFPSVSESGYSTPDSKTQKKVIYEVIV